MAVRKVYGAVGSTATMRVLASVYEHGLDFEFIAIDLRAGEHKQEAFLSLNPFGQVPVFQDDELTLFESRAVMRYISYMYPTPEHKKVLALPKLQGITAGWIDIEDHQFNPPASKLIMELVFKPKFFGLQANEDLVKEEEAKLVKVLDVYEMSLSQSKYLGSDNFNTADLTHFPNLYYLMGTPVKRLFTERPLVSAWTAAILARPALVKVVEMVEKS